MEILPMRNFNPQADQGQKGKCIVTNNRLRPAIQYNQARHRRKLTIKCNKKTPRFPLSQVN